MKRYLIYHILLFIFLFAFSPFAVFSRENNATDTPPKSEVIENTTAGWLFKDLSPFHWATDSVISLQNLGAISGYNDRSFRPNDSITRAAFFKIATIASVGYTLQKENPHHSHEELTDAIADKIADVILNNPQKNKLYIDVNHKHWAYPYASFLTIQEIISGYADNSLRLDKSITRAEATKIIIKMLGINGGLIKSSDIPFRDIGQHDWHRPFTLVAKHIKLIRGYEDNTFRSNNPISRAEVSKILFELSQFEGSGLNLKYQNKKIDFIPLLIVNRSPEDSDIRQIIDKNFPFNLIIEKRDAHETWYYFMSNSPSQWQTFSVNVPAGHKIYIGYILDNAHLGVYGGQGTSALKINDSVVIAAKESLYAQNISKKVVHAYEKNEMAHGIRYMLNDETQAPSFYTTNTISPIETNLWMELTNTLKTGENTISLYFTEGLSCGVLINVKQ